MLTLSTRRLRGRSSATLLCGGLLLGIFSSHPLGARAIRASAGKSVRGSGQRIRNDQSAAKSHQSQRHAPPTESPTFPGFWKGPLIIGGMFKSVGGPPFTSAGEEAYKYNLAKSVNPEALCLFAGIPRASISGVPFEIVQNSNRVAFLYELMWTFRTIPLGGREHPKRYGAVFFWGRRGQSGTATRW